LKSIVIVDDEEDLCNLFSEVLQKYGYSVLSFVDPLQALVHIQANPNQYCLLISDFRMNKLNGCELGIKVQELNNNIKVIIISACENIQGNFRNFEFLNKPISITNLITKVRSYVK
jgi:DNA-binding NtrC family response regulator